MNKVRLSLAVALCIAGGGLLASDSTSTNSTENSPQNTLKLGEITVVSATGFEQNIVDAPASISVITSKEIQKASYRNIEDVVKNVAGVSLSEARRGERDISIRGMDPKYTMTMINGKPILAGEIGGWFSGGLNINALPPLNMVERVEVIRGPMSSLYGSEAVGGMVNVITKKASNDWTASISSQYNFFQDNNMGAHYNTGVYVAGPIIKDALGIELNGIFGNKNEDEMKDKRYEYRLEAKNKSKNVGGKLSLVATDRDIVSFEYQHSSNDIIRHPNKSYWDKEGNHKKDVFTLDHEGKYDKLTMQSYLRYDKSKYFGTITANKNYKVGGDKDTLTFNTQGTYSFDRHMLTLGINYLSEKFKEVSYKETSRWNVAIYGEDDFFITDDLILTLGARLNKNERYGTHFSPRAYAVYHINDYFTIKGGVSSGYINPGLIESEEDSLVESGRGSGANIGNKKLKPETSLNYEAGFAYNDEKMNLSVIGFYSDFKDKIGLRELCHKGQEFNSTTWGCGFKGKNYHATFLNDNLGSSYFGGLEVSFDYKILSNLEFRSSYTYIKTKYKDGEKKGKITKQLPQHVLNLGLDYNPIDKLNLWMNVSYKHKEKNAIGWESRTDFGKPAYTVANIGLVYKLNQYLNLNAGVYNLFNEDPSYLNNTGAWGKVNKFVDGRKFMFGFNANF